jgi:Bardet-Biedl syndrome 9 protein
LHPKKLVVYNVAPHDSNYLQLMKLYEHGFEHTAANMTYGPFGGGRAGKVQIMDGGI